MLGRFNEFLHPVVEIEVSGTGKAKKLEAVVDTGSNGWLQLPYKEAFPLGLILSGVEDGTTMADGRISHNFVCQGKVKVDGIEVATIIDVYPTGPILIGTKLLQVLKRKVVCDVNKKIIEVVESA